MDFTSRRMPLHMIAGLLVALGVLACGVTSVQVDPGESADVGSLAEPDASGAIDAGPIDGGHPDAAQAVADAGADAGPRPDAAAPDAGAADAATSPPLVLCSTDGFCWDHPRPHGDDVNGIWVGSPTDIWTVGNGARHFDGATWTDRSQGLSQRMDRISGAGSELWACGYAGLWRWNGSAWAAQPGAPQFAADVQVRAANDIWTFAGNAVSHFDGTRWTTATAPFSASALWATSDTEAWVVDRSGNIAHGLSGVWQKMTAPANPGLLTLWGSSPSDVWAGGNGGTLLHWNGTSWAPESSGTTGTISHLFGTSATHRFAIANGSIRRYANGAWGASLTSGFKRLAALAGSGPGEVWAAGQAGQLHRFDGTSWTRRDTAVSNDWLQSVSAVSADEVWAVGLNSAILKRTAAGWAPVATPYTHNDLFAVWAFSRNDVWVGGTGILAHFDGTAWRNDYTADTITGFHGRSATDLWAIGYSGTAYHFDGSAWSQTATGTSSLYAIFAVSPTDVWAVGARPTTTSGPAMSHYDGTSWTVYASPATWQNLNGLWGTSGTEVYAVGHQDILLRWNGTSWGEIAVPAGVATTVGFTRVTGDASGRLFFSGLFGAVATLQAGQWTRYQSGSSGILYSLALGPDGALWVVGDGGAVLRRAP